MIPDPGLILAMVTGGGLGAAIVLLGLGIRGTTITAARPQRRWQRALAAVRDPRVVRRIVAAIAAGVLVVAVTGWPVGGAGIGALILAWPRMFGGGAAERLRVARLEALVIWVESLRDVISAGVSLEQAIPLSAEHAPDLIHPALERLAGRMRAHTPVDDALKGLAADLDDGGADLVIAALILNAQRRGNLLGAVLSNLAKTSREELELRQRISAARAGLRRGVQIVVAVTVGIALYLSVFGGAFLEPYQSVQGQGALALVLGIFTGGFWWLRALAADDDTGGFLSRPDARLSPAEQRIVAALMGARIGISTVSDAPSPVRPPWGGTR